MSVLLFLVSLEAALLVLGAGNTVGYHRLFTHRAFKAATPVRAILAVLGALHSGPPLLWIGLHRLHHLRSEDPEDPHTPRYQGLWYAHTGWLAGRLLKRPVGTVGAVLFAISGFGQQLATLAHDIRRVRGQNPSDWLELCKDLADDPVLRILERPFVTTLLFGAQLGLAILIGGGWGLLWLWLLHLVLTNSSWAVNSICHGPQFGRAPYKIQDDSRDVPWLSFLTLGESYHNGHHRYPRSARHGLKELDLSWLLIQGLVKLGLASEPWLPKESVRK